jgi:hypothetical protein
MPVLSDPARRTRAALARGMTMMSFEQNRIL